MTRSGTVIFCRCRHTPLVLADDVRRVEAALQASGGAAGEVGGAVVVIDDLCDLAARGDARLAEWAGRAGVTIIACFPRAVRALFAHAGASLPDDATVHNLRKAGAVAVLRSMGVSPMSPTGVPPVVDVPAAPAWPAWFPVIDRERCTRCRKCLSFCLFSVYEFAGGEVRVARPANCKNNCPACARVCPARAIIFPKCKDAPINGDDPDQSPTGDFRADAAKLAPEDLKEVLRRRAGHSQKTTATEVTENAESSEEKGKHNIVRDG